ncbi:MAG: YjbQ family protein [Acidimicrobiia bacterium]
MISEELTFRTGNRPVTVDITGELAKFVQARGDGLLSVFVPHATAGVAIIETGAGSDHDLLAAIENLLPAERGRWRHEHGSPGHGRDHVLPAFVSPSVTIPVLGARLALGIWQSVVLVDTNVDNSIRTVRLTLIEG